MFVKIYEFTDFTTLIEIWKQTMCPAQQITDCIFINTCILK